MSHGRHQIFVSQLLVSLAFRKAPCCWAEEKQSRRATELFAQRTLGLRLVTGSPTTHLHFGAHLTLYLVVWECLSWPTCQLPGYSVQVTTPCPTSDGFQLTYVDHMHVHCCQLLMSILVLCRSRLHMCKPMHTRHQPAIVVTCITPVQDAGICTDIGSATHLVLCLPSTAFAYLLLHLEYWPAQSCCRGSCHVMALSRALLQHTTAGRVSKGVRAWHAKRATRRAKSAFQRAKHAERADKIWDFFAV